ncbi:RagB/SusD family nutrient uptake outer membrane protein [Mucilaginibacter sp. P19]|uniref:RagB/SusD family nutrient uptake outer membrane protein n=1 Tax=Mucilaginibacter sp. P19 TaxID=3423947 RepID=UPI003D66437F
MYDNILIDTIPTTVNNAFDPVQYKPATKQQVLSLISSDLDFAIANLSYVAQPGEVSQGLARHLRAQVAAWQGDWATMAAQCDAVINTGPYALQPLEKVFGADVNHNESLYTYQFDELTGGSSNLAGGEQHFLNAVLTARYYEMPGGHMIEDNNWGGNSFAWTTPNFYLKTLLGWDKTTGLSPDKRFTTYFFPDTVVGNKPGDPYYGRKLPKSSYSDNYRQYHWSVKKYQDFTKPDGRAGSYKDVIAYRLAETLLLGAEAHWRLTNNGSDPTALMYINRIRARAGMPNFTSIDQQTILDEIGTGIGVRGRALVFIKKNGSFGESGK